MTADERRGVALAGAAVALIGGSVAAAGSLADYPVLGGQAIRCAIGTAALWAWGRLRRRRLRMPSAREAAWLTALAVIGVAGYGVLLVHATAATDPAAVGVAIGAAPLAIVVSRAVATATRPGRRTVAGAGIVLVGTACAQLTSGYAMPGPIGLVWIVAVIASVASITLLAMPVVDTMGSSAVTTWSCGIAAVVLAVASAVVGVIGGRPAIRVPDVSEAAAIAFLSLGVTVLVTLLWYGAMARLGAGRVGLFNGLVPSASLGAVVVTGVGTVSPVEVAGAALVLAGVVIGLGGLRPVGSSRRSAEVERPVLPGAVVASGR